MNGDQLSTSAPGRGYLLARARQARGWTQPQMARLLREFSRQEGHPLSTGRDGIWYWEHSRCPDHPTQILIAGLLSIPPDAVDERPWPEWLAADPAQRPPGRPWTVRGAAEALSELSGSSVDTTRRDLFIIGGGALTSALLAWIVADTSAAGQISGGRRIGEAAVGRLEKRAAALRAIDDEDGGGTVLEESFSALTLTTGLIRRSTYSDTHGARLYSVASDLARQYAAALFDMHGVCSDKAFETSLRAAKAGGDDAIGANCLAFWASAAYNTGRRSDAEAMASAGLAAVRGRAAPSVVAVLETRRGRARARLGDAGSLSSFDRAEELLGQAGTEPGPDWADWIDQAEIHAARGSSQLDLGRPKQAEDNFAAARQCFDPSIIRTQVVYLARQASAQLDQGKADQAVATGHIALDMAEAISSRRSADAVLDLARACTADDSHVPGGRDLAERARATLTE